MGRKMLWLALVVVAAVTLSACGGDDGGSPGGGGGSASDLLEVVAPSGAANSGYGVSEFRAPADTALTIHFVNEDAGIPHDVRIYEGTDTSGTPVFAPPEMITGPAETDYQVPALAAGTYTLTCIAHPTTMHATLTVG
jgi:plastocyanin